MSNFFKKSSKPETVKLETIKPVNNEGKEMLRMKTKIEDILNNQEGFYILFNQILDEHKKLSFVISQLRDQMSGLQDKVKALSCKPASTDAPLLPEKTKLKIEKTISVDDMVDRWGDVWSVDVDTIAEMFSDAKGVTEQDIRNSAQDIAEMFNIDEDDANLEDFIKDLCKFCLPDKNTESTDTETELFNLLSENGKDYIQDLMACKTFEDAQKFNRDHGGWLWGRNRQAMIEDFYSNKL